MNNTENKIEELLKHCEDKESHKYSVDPSTYKCKIPLWRDSAPEPTIPVKYNCKDKEEIFIVSDLHISSGRNNSGVCPGTENFFADEGFKRFLDYAEKVKKSETAILIINGDVFDFLRVTEYPGKIKKTTLLKQFRRLIKGKGILKLTEEQRRQIKEVGEQEFKRWQETLRKTGIEIETEELKKLRKSEKKYGLGTNNYKSIWKLQLISRGHPEFFKSLASWLEAGNKIFILKGNHDLEWYLLSVRNYLRLLLAEIICKEKPGDIAGVLEDTVLPNIYFFDDSVVIDNDFYVEHGHRYDKFTFVIDNPLLPDSGEIKPQARQAITDELNIPFGSFFNRYVINTVELFYPFADNVRPGSNLLPMMIRERFPLAIKILLDSRDLIKRIFRTLKGKYIRFMFSRILWLVLVALIPLGFLIYFNLDNIITYFFTPVKPISRFNDFLNNLIKSSAVVVIAYVASRIVSWFQLTEPDSLVEYAKEIFKRNPDYRIITMGHTHNPGEYKIRGGRWFYNTGTWIPIVEASSAEIREDKTYTFLHLERDSEGKLQPSNHNLLMRWNDDALRADPLVIVEKK